MSNAQIVNNKLVPNDIIAIPSNLKSFFKYWLEFLTPLHKLTRREIDIAAALLFKRYQLSKSITNDALLDKITLNEESKRELREDCGVSVAHFQIIMGKLRKSNIIINNKINKKFIPHLNLENNSTFKLMLYFKINEEESPNNITSS